MSGDSGVVDLLIRNATVVNATGRTAADLAINGGTIDQLAEPGTLKVAAAREIDLGGRLLLPGGVDPHCHIAEEVGAYRASDSPDSTSRAALFGGTTTLMTFAIPQKGESPLEAARAKVAGVEKTWVDVAVHGGLIDWTPETAGEIEELARLGVKTLKMFTTYAGVRKAEYTTITRALETLSRVGGMALLHAEADHIIDSATVAHAVGDSTPAHRIGLARPPIAENAEVANLLSILRYTDAPAYFVHQSTRTGPDAIAGARRQGVAAVAETCPHYLLLDQRLYEGTAPELLVCCPPIRSERERTDLVRSVLQGNIDTIGSDHCCFTRADKQRGPEDVVSMPHGLPGVETRIPAAYTALVAGGGLSLERFVALTSTRPAEIFGLRGKGVIGVGMDADMYVLDEDTTRTAAARMLHMDTDYTPYEGLELRGWPELVITKGVVCVEDGDFVADSPVGSFLPTSPHLPW